MIFLRINITILLMAFLPFRALPQNCINVDTNVLDDYSYSNKRENLSLPFNTSWSVAFENQGAILVALTDSNQQGQASILKNKNGYSIGSAYDLSANLITQLFQGAGMDVYEKKMTNTYLKNIKTKQVEYDYKVYNLGDTHYMSGIMFLLVKGGYTYVFMFNCTKAKKACYMPFYKNVMKQSFFGQEWY
jgi:hypothetical protein